MSEKLFKYATQMAKEAVKLDKEGKPKLAVQKYIQAADILMRFLKLTKNPALRKTCYEKAEQYVQRAKELQGISPGLSVVSEKAAGKAITKEDQALQEAISDTIITEKPSVEWEDVANLETAKQALREAVILPMLRPDIFTGAREPWRGLLLVGPPGCGKTLLAKAVANECNATFFSADAASLVSKWLGESEKLVATLFTVARRGSPSVIFIDEVDALATVRSGDEVGGERRMKTQLLIEMDGVRKRKGEQVVVLGATNRPWDLDPAFRRRFEKRIYVPLPDNEGRREIFRIHVRGIEIAPDVDFDELATLTEGYSGSDIALICRDAAMMPIRELDTAGTLTRKDIMVRPVNREDFIKSMKKIKPTVSPDELQKYEEWTKEFASE
ncbi:MAG: AAA family ATPase [Candidatus Hodarchaeota archaeon]